MNEPLPQYREARLIDAVAIFDFIRPFVDARQLLPRSEQQLLALTRHGFIAEVDGELTGFAAIEVYSRKLAEVQCLAVAESMQGRGVGRRLVDLCIERAVELGVGELMAISASEKFLTGCGFHYSLPDQKKALFVQPQRLGETDQAATVTAASLWHDHMDTMRWPPRDAHLIETIDAHAAGEPLRVLLRGAPLVVGKTMMEKRRYAEEHIDDLRRALMWEPRGHADMYGALMTAPTTDDGDLGVLFLHNDGFSTMCGHGVIALGTVLWETGMTSDTEIRLDTPAGRVHVTLDVDGQRAQRVSFVNVPAFVDRLDHQVDIPGLGEISIDVAFGGAYYAFCDAATVGLKLDADNTRSIIQLGRTIKQTLQADASFSLRHPNHVDLGFLYGVIFVSSPVKPSSHSRHACVFANGELDRSPTGTGVSARAAILSQRGELATGKMIAIEGVCNEVFDVEVLDAEVIEELEITGLRTSVSTRVGGAAYLTGRCQWVRRDNDPLRDGILLR